MNKRYGMNDKGMDIVSGNNDILDIINEIEKAYFELKRLYSCSEVLSELQSVTVNDIIDDDYMFSDVDEYYSVLNSHIYRTISCFDSLTGIKQRQLFFLTELAFETMNSNVYEYFFNDGNLRFKDLGSFMKCLREDFEDMICIECDLSKLPITFKDLVDLVDGYEIVSIKNE